ncbi:hypothetical protein G7K71_13685 [Desulfofundulus sp. TPOSR]|uniref:hypothetical protein n=1 Tax=Desulfofundulus sp. TPOSR TaxID=2714340 RepID=UPI00140B5465|nr:hypothetical protein [Desulfofundulus sp. TPOSR]NHM28009.1 hypothetical protein [Desulfofundulus sp. TPOSR]
MTSIKRKPLDWDWLEIYREEVDRLGMPHCAVCGRRLHVGDEVDGAWPWFEDFNLCRDCRGAGTSPGGTGGAQG